MISFPSSQDLALMILKQQIELEDWKFLFLNFQVILMLKENVHLIPKEKRLLGNIWPYSPESSVVKESACNAGDPGSIPGLGRSSGEGIGYPLQYSWLPLWFRWQRICLQCRRPGFDPWVGKIPWRRERLATPVFWPAEFHGQYSPWGRKESDTTEWLSLTVLK